MTPVYMAWKYDILKTSVNEANCKSKNLLNWVSYDMNYVCLPRKKKKMDASSILYMIGESTIVQLVANATVGC